MDSHPAAALRVSLLVALFLTACGAASAQAIPDNLPRPGTPVYQQLIWDCITGHNVPESPSAANPIQPNSGCDSWQINRYERPFNAQSQDEYFADLDLVSAEMGRDGEWVYVRLTVFQENESTDLLQGNYAIEFDLDLDGRGDVLLLSRLPVSATLDDWTVLGVQFWGDGDNDVGDDQPAAPDPPSQSDGYDTLVFDQGVGDDPGLAWARLSASAPRVLELAFKEEAILHDAVFKWWAWSDVGVDDRAGADYHDAFDHPVAGDPIVGQAFFPSQAIFSVDNTCASLWGAAPDEDPELCVNDPAVPPPSFGPSSITTPETTLTPSPTERRTSETPTPTPPSVTATPCLPQASTVAAPSTCTPTPTLTPSLSSPTPTHITSTPCVSAANTAAGIAATCTPTPTRITSTPCVSAANTAAGIAFTCTPTPTRITSTPCVVAGTTANVAAVTCTPVPTRNTLTPTPTVCFTYDSNATSFTALQVATCTPTVTISPTPTDCVVPYAFAVIHCTPTPTLLPSVTPTRCGEINAATGQFESCTPTVSLTPSPTLCVIVGAAALIPCTPTPTPTECVLTSVAGAVITCTPTPEVAAAMAYPEEDTNCREAPNGRIIDTLFQGEAYLMRGRDALNQWIFLRGPNGRLCWAFAILFTFTHDGVESELSEIPLDWLPNILTPAPTLTPTPNTGGAPAATKTPTSPPPQCNDGIDNDGDGLIDMADGRCKDPTDNSESN